MADKQYRASLYRTLHRPALWELAVVELTPEPGKEYATAVVDYRELSSGVGMAPSVCDRNKALEEMGMEVARYQAWDWFESSNVHGEPTYLIGRVQVIKAPGAVTIVDDEEYPDAGV